MAFAFQGAGAPDYAPCHYTGSRLAFRGPERPVTGRYLACLGGTETYGRFVDRPFPDLLEAELGLPVLNLGCANAGPDVFLSEPGLLPLIERAEAVVVQVGTLANLSNAFYSVHPRRNDRFLGATQRLRALYRDVDFTEFSFTHHLLQGLAAVSANRFQRVMEELRNTWLRQMRCLLALMPGRAVLLSMPGPGRGDAFAPDRDLLKALRPCCTAILTVLPPTKSEEPAALSCAPFNLPAARLLPCPAHHRHVARALLPALRPLLK